jgi:hypothetical protein
MATYKGIKGVYILRVASDPSTLTEGMVWFNTTDGKMYLRKSASTVSITAS